MGYDFYGHEQADVTAVSAEYPGITNPKELYDALSGIWCEYTCAPRLRSDWSPENRTLGQCSITAFLVQDLLGGEVRGIPLADGSVHCFNVVEGFPFDLTSAQFGDEALDYENRPLQSREEHFADAGKRQRYELLKARLREARKGKHKREN